MSDISLSRKHNTTPTPLHRLTDEQRDRHLLAYAEGYESGRAARRNYRREMALYVGTNLIVTTLVCLTCIAICVGAARTHTPQGPGVMLVGYGCAAGLVALTLILSVVAMCASLNGIDKRDEARSRQPE